MTELRHKVKNALDEARTLILCAQVLLGFEFRSFFEPGFETLPQPSRWIQVAGLACMLIALILMFTPAAFHRIVEQGRDTERLHRVVTSIMCWSLLPFALGFAIDCFIVGEKSSDAKMGILAGAATLFVALFFWYGLQLLVRRWSGRENKMKTDHEDEKILNTKIEQVLTEIRMILPGVQALLGFQMGTVMMQSFEQLPASSKGVHFVALLLIAVSAIFLMTPAAYHRIVEKGEDTERFHTFASRMLIAAMVPLPLGVAGEVFVVLRKFTDSVEWSLLAGSASLVLAWVLWFGVMMLRRAKDQRTEARDSVRAPA